MTQVINKWNSFTSNVVKVFHAVFNKRNFVIAGFIGAVILGMWSVNNVPVVKGIYLTIMDVETTLEAHEAKLTVNNRWLSTQKPIALVSEVKAEVVEPTPDPTPAPIVVASGSPEQLMQQAGIAQSDWYSVNCVIAGCEGYAGEAGWNGTLQWNTQGSGAYGICQALPASKMASAGADYMTNKLTQLKWCNQYAIERYGGWKAAWTFRKCVHRVCTNHKTGWSGYKNHTWW